MLGVVSLELLLVVVGFADVVVEGFSDEEDDFWALLLLLLLLDVFPVVLDGTVLITLEALELLDVSDDDDDFVVLDGFAVVVSDLDEVFAVVVVVVLFDELLEEVVTAFAFAEAAAVASASFLLVVVVVSFFVVVVVFLVVVVVFFVEVVVVSTALTSGFTVVLAFFVEVFFFVDECFFVVVVVFFFVEVTARSAITGVSHSPYSDWHPVPQYATVPPHMPSELQHCPKGEPRHVNATSFPQVPSCMSVASGLPDTLAASKSAHAEKMVNLPIFCLCQTRTCGEIRGIKMVVRGEQKQRRRVQRLESCSLSIKHSFQR